jgi:hypothetical protein
LWREATEHTNHLGSLLNATANLTATLHVVDGLAAPGRPNRETARAGAGARPGTRTFVLWLIVVDTTRTTLLDSHGLTIYPREESISVHIAGHATARETRTQDRPDLSRI